MNKANEAFQGKMEPCDFYTSDFKRFRKNYNKVRDDGLCSWSKDGTCLLAEKKIFSMNDCPLPEERRKHRPERQKKDKTHPLLERAGKEHIKVGE